MTTIDPIPALETLGYTEREASFLYLVAMHSGYFLRRQFDYFIDRHKGAIAQHFLEKARVAGHIRVLDYGQRWHVYHLFPKPIYRLLGNSDSQHRRAKGDAQIKAKLMALDYVLENDAEHFLASEEERRDYFTLSRGLPAEILGNHSTGSLPFLNAFPVSLTDRMDPKHSSVRFSFIDEGQLSTAKFLRFVVSMKPIFDALGHVELIYVADSEHNFPAIRHIFSWHLRPLVPPDERNFNSHLRADSRHSYAGSRRVPSKLTTVLFEYSYPRLHRYEARGSKQGSHPGSTASTTSEST